MGAKTCMLIYSDGNVAEILKSKPKLDRIAANKLAVRFFKHDEPASIEDGNLMENANPRDGRIYVGSYPGLAIVASSEVGGDYPSKLDKRFIAAAGAGTVYLHAMHSVVDWFAYGIWKNGQLVRSLSVAPDGGIFENIGNPLPFEEPYWSGKHPVEVDPGESPYPLPFHPLELGEAMLRSQFGFNYEGEWMKDDPDLENIILAGYEVKPRTILGRIIGWFS